VSSSEKSPESSLTAARVFDPSASTAATTAGVTESTLEESTCKVADLCRSQGIKPSAYGGGEETEQIDEGAHEQEHDRYCDGEPTESG
jgi:hypothetical protein